MVPPSATIALAQSATEKRLTYIVTAHSLNGSTLTYSVDPGDSSGLLTTSTGGRTFATGGTKTFTATVTDAHGGVTVVSASAQADVAPTAILLSASTIAENAGSNATVGTLSCTDANTGDTYTYTLVSGTGSTNNALFNISGSTLRATSSLNFESTPTCAIRVRSTDQNAITFEQQFTITVTNVNEAPSDIALSANSFAHTEASGFTIGTLSTTDVDAGDTFTYTLVSGTGSTDNASFSIVGAALKVGASPVAAGSYSVRVRSTDAGGLYFEKSFALTST